MKGETVPRRSAMAYPRLFVLLQALWILPAIQPASAQAPFPPGFISPYVPHDVAAGSGADVQVLAVFAWNEFIALNWVALDPATTGMRGRPDLTADFLSIAPGADGAFPLTVWQTYQHKNEMFPSDGNTNPDFDSREPRYVYLSQPAQGKSFPLDGSEPTTDPSFTLFNNLDETTEIGLANMFAHYISPANNIRIAYEAKSNRAVFDYINKNGYTVCPPADGYCPQLSSALTKTSGDLAQYGGICSTDPTLVSTIVSLPCGDANVAGDDGEGAIEIKAAWRALTDDEIASGRFYTQKVIYYVGQGTDQTYNNAVYGLIALHIIHKTRSFPTFVFASFEQVDNYDDENDENTQDLKYINLTPVEPPIPNDPVTRAHAIHSQVQAINADVHATFTAANPNTVWQYYKLIGVQGTPVSGPPDPMASLPDDVSYYYLANLVVESNQTLQNFFGEVGGDGQTQPFNNVYLHDAPGSPFQMGGCQGCHGKQAQSLGGDMSRIIALAPYASGGPPDSIDMGPVESLRAYLARSNALPPDPIGSPEPPPPHKGHRGHHDRWERESRHGDRD